VQASPHAAGAAYVTLDAHCVGDMKTYVYRTGDYGKTWERLDSPDLRGYAHVVREDRVAPNLLFVGTELGLFLSLDSGKTWAQFKAGLPDVAVRDMIIQPREDDLLLATHGRGIYVIDDIRCLRGLTPAVLASDAACSSRALSAPLRPPSSAEARSIAATLEEAAFVTYLKKRPMFGDLKIEVYDAWGTTAQRAGSEAARHQPLPWRCGSRWPERISYRTLTRSSDRACGANTRSSSSRTRRPTPRSSRSLPIRVRRTAPRTARSSRRRCASSTPCSNR
jgi:hypothetical protein